MSALSDCLVAKLRHLMEEKDFSTNKCIFQSSAPMPNPDKNDKQDEKGQTTIARHRQTGIESCPQHQLRSLAICLPSRRNADYFCNLQTFIRSVECVSFSANRGINTKSGGWKGEFCANKAAETPQKKKEGKKKEKKINSAFFLY